MKVLIVDDDPFVVLEVKETIEAYNSVVTSFEPISETREEIRIQLKKLCQNTDFKVVLLDYDLWNHLTGDILVDIFQEAKIPFIAFSGRSSSNELLVKLGAISSINKEGLYGSKGFDRSKFGRIFMETVFQNTK